MNLRNWMEVHIGIPKRKQKNASKKDKTKKNISGLSVRLPSLPPSAELDSAGNSPCSPISPRDDLSGITFYLSSNLQLYQQHSYCFHLNPRTTAPSIISDSDHRQNHWGWPSNDSARRQEAVFATSIDALPHQVTPSSRSIFHVTPLERCRQLPEAANSPRQRNKIRTNPWLTPKMCGTGEDERRSFLASSSSSDCASLCNSSMLSPSDGSCYSDSCMASTEGSDVSTSELGFIQDILTEPTDPDNGCVVRQPPHLGFGTRLPTLCHRSTPPRKQKNQEDGMRDLGRGIRMMLDECKDSEDDAIDTLPPGMLDNNQLGCRRLDLTRQPRNSHINPKKDFNIDKTYFEISDSLVGECSYRKSVAKKHGRTLRSWKLEVQAEDDDDREGGGGGVEEDEARSLFRRGGFQADSAFPSESESSSLETSVVTTPLLGTALSCGSSDSGIQPSMVSKSTFNLECERSLESVRESLCEKVHRLRLERLVVEEKIREAKEEEELRQVEKDKFQKELVVHRRQVLLRTLHDLRVKLEEQSARLQEAYQVTLRMQLSRRQLMADVTDKGSPLGKLM